MTANFTNCQLNVTALNNSHLLINVITQMKLLGKNYVTDETVKIVILKYFIDNQNVVTF